jgi:hypothetical protein
MKEALDGLIEEIWTKEGNSSLNGSKTYLNVG